MKRTTAIGVGVVVVVAVVAAGAFAMTTLLDDQPTADEQVPGTVDAVVRVDMAITDDRVSREIAKTAVESAPMVGLAPDNVSTLLAEFETQTGLDPDEARDVVAFGWQANDSMSVEEAGVIVHGDWEEPAVRDAVAGNGSQNLTATTHAGQRVSRPSDDGQWVGVLGEGQYVVGTEMAVKRTIDVVVGDRNTFDGQLRSSYDATENGLITVAARVPSDQVPSADSRAVDITRYQQVGIVAGSYYTTDTGGGVQFRLRTNSTEAAQDVADVTSGGLAFARGTVENETVEDNLRAIEVEREETTVVVTYEQSVGGFEALVRYYQNDDDEESAGTLAREQGRVTAGGELP